MSTKADEVKLDIKELEKLLQQASRKKVKDVISVEIQKLQTDLKKLEIDEKNASIKPSDATVNISQRPYEVKLNNYGWDQTIRAVMLYVTLENVEQLPKESVVCNFTEKSLDLHVLGLNNKNYVLKINNLCEEIEPTKSSFKVKRGLVIVSVIKKEMKTWPGVTGIEKRIKTSKLSVPDTDDDPASNLMNLFKTLYVNGDDDMKRTIEKSWTKSLMKNGAELSEL